MTNADFLRLVNDAEQSDLAYIKRDEVVAIAPKVHPQLGLLPNGATIVLRGGVMLTVSTAVDRVAELLGIAPEKYPEATDAVVILES